MEQAVHFFVSFSSRDLKYVREIMAALHGQDIDHWDYSDDAHSIGLGKEIDDRLFSEIDLCTHMIVVISENSMNHKIGKFCKRELQYALNRDSHEIQFIPVIVPNSKPGRLKQFIRSVWSVFSKDSHNNLELKPPYDIFENRFCYELDDSPESIVGFTIKVCQDINKIYVPPIKAHLNLPFWELFRKEVEGFAHSNKDHTDLIEMLGLFNEYYKRDNPEMALKLIKLFIDTCDVKIIDYLPFYPFLVMAVCETEMNQLDNALKTYSKAAEMDKLNQDAIGGEGTVYFKMKKYAEAKKCFEQILNNGVKENKDNARINLIITKMAMDTELSEEEERFLLNFNVDHFPVDLKIAVLNAQGMVYRIKKNYELLEEHCLKIRGGDLHDTITVILLYLSYHNRNMHTEAKQVIRQALKEAVSNLRLDKDALREYEKD